MWQLHYKTYAKEVDKSPTSHLRIGRPDGVKGIRHKEVCVLEIGLMHVYYSKYIYYLMLFVIYVIIG